MNDDLTADTEQEFSDLLTDALYEAGIDNVRSFEDAGLLTRNEGLVILIGSSEFQITIVQSA
jgi:hypothetical protein